MNDIAELEGRLASALQRIGAGLDSLSRPVEMPELAAPPQNTEELDALRRELQAEREVTAQLEERVRAIRQTQDDRVAELETALAGLEAHVAPLKEERQRMKAVNAALRETIAALRKANSAGLADAALVNQAMETELAALGAAQASDSAELAGIIAELAPLVTPAGGHDA